MKQFVIVVALCVIVSVQAITDEQKAKVKEYQTACVASTGVDPKLVEEGEKGNFITDAKLREFISCFLKKTGIQDEAGEIQASVIKQKLANDYTEAEIDAVLAKCKSSGGTPAEVAAAFYKCYWANASKHVPLV
uniref:Odorant binding protein 21 n=1 Tax=Holotrichia oblita TaxID=644536 RepID=A0A3Q8U622_HOLOL|nr:odorant binding protein 21 [Holotrichia oblita]